MRRRSRSGPDDARPPCSAAGSCCARSSLSDFDAWREVRRRNADWLTQVGAAARPRRSPTSIDGPRRVRGALQRPPARAPARHRLRLRHLRRRRRSPARSTSPRCSAAPFQSALRRLLDRREARRQRLHARGASWCSPASRSTSCASTACRSRSSPATAPAGGSSRSWASARRASRVRYLEINGVWEDHVRYAITSEEWDERRDELREGVAVAALSAQRLRSMRLERGEPRGLELGLTDRPELGLELARRPPRRGRRRPACAASVAFVRGPAARGARRRPARPASGPRRASSSSSTQRHTRPTRSASAPSRTSPNSTVAAAACGPDRALRASRCGRRRGGCRAAGSGCRSGPRRRPGARRTPGPGSCRRRPRRR